MKNRLINILIKYPVFSVMQNNISPLFHEAGIYILVLPIEWCILYFLQTENYYLYVKSASGCRPSYKPAFARTILRNVKISVLQGTTHSGIHVVHLLPFTSLSLCSTIPFILALPQFSQKRQTSPQPAPRLA